MEHYEVAIVGAGQAGITIGYYLKKEKVPFIILDKNEKAGDSWRKRYDSLILFTPRKYSSLPGLHMNGLPEGLPTKQEMADYLTEYVNYFKLPILNNVTVEKLDKIKGFFYLDTNKGIVGAKKVVIATGAFQKPYVPSFAKTAEESFYQLHSAAYRSPDQLPGHSVLIVGGGNSGAQIAVELSKEKTVTIAVNHPFKFLPLYLFGKSIFDWLKFTGLLYAGINTTKGNWFRKQKDPVFGQELKACIEQGKVDVKPKVIGIEGKTVVFQDNSQQSFDSIIWSTGFVPSYDWITVEGVVSSEGKPIHERGVSPIKGMYFIGLPWQHQRGSALICGVDLDAKFLIHRILEKD
ncbi:flavin-containing monooxygenase [Domibacillus robiginosus]|uniref:flavin-containing monooxygenase n=1 Tax=Domibacillus robiginosus TaxID=1071054 RepID=UPI00067AD4D5|nr:NAD(P)-binding domain-containing protein [Domibacillus robiginosus]